MIHPLYLILLGIVLLGKNNLVFRLIFVGDRGSFGGKNL